MTTTNKIPTTAELNACRPADPSKISFAAECFVFDGEEVYYTVSNAVGWGYPQRFSTREEAEANRHGTQIVSEIRSPRRVRVKWF